MATPLTATLARFAARLHFADLPDADVQRALSDERVFALHRRVHLHVDPRMAYMGRGCRVRVRLGHGGELEHAIDLPRGEP